MIAALTAVLMILLVIVDQLSKVIMDIWLQPIGSAPMMPGFLQFTYAENTGVAFGLMSNMRWLFLSVTTVVMLGALFLMFSGKIKNKVAYFGTALIVAGGMGNWIDRVFRGYVIDFIEPQFVHFAIFNIADCLVSVGAAGVLGFLVYDIVMEFKGEKKKVKVQK